MTHDFRLVLDQPTVSDAEAELIYGQCKDATLITAGETTYLDFDRNDVSLEAAIRSAISDVSAAGFTVNRVEIDSEGFSTQPA